MSQAEGRTALLRWQRRFTPADDFSFVPLEFEVPPGAAALELRFRYAPQGSNDPSHNQAAVRRAVELYLGQVAPAGPEDVDRLIAARGMQAQERFLRSLLNLVLYDPAGGMVGRWDLGRHPDPPPVWISAQQASPGFFPCPIRPGTWRLAVEVWEVFTPELEATLELTALGEIVEERGAAGVPPAAVNPPPTFPPVRPVVRPRLPGV